MTDNDNEDPNTEYYKGIQAFQDYCKTLTCQEIGALLVEYVLEAAHGGWDAAEEDVPAISRFLKDMVTYGAVAGKRNPVIFTGVEYCTADRPTPVEPERR